MVAVAQKQQWLAEVAVVAQMWLVEIDGGDDLRQLTINALLLKMLFRPNRTVKHHQHKENVLGYISQLERRLEPIRSSLQDEKETYSKSLQLNKRAVKRENIHVLHPRRPLSTWSLPLVQSRKSVSDMSITLDYPKRTLTALTGFSRPIVTLYRFAILSGENVDVLSPYRFKYCVIHLLLAKIFGFLSFEFKGL
ncbi:Uncharacterized protein Fot_10402 [Forsythia ovata]|uniref:Uncharacterized protein n=1 Tax=Forsythia ovata TaxID=205694 RepID=A0ABD1WGZ5_9LAMI